MPSLKPGSQEKLQSLLQELAQQRPGCFLSVASPTEILFSGSAGEFDKLDQGKEGSRQVTESDIVWFASTTKLITAVAYLTLVDRGVLTLDTDMGALFPPLAAATSQILTGFPSDASNGDKTPVDFSKLLAPGSETAAQPSGAQPEFKPATNKVTLQMMLNQTSGFGMEFGPDVQRWKQYVKETGGKGAGYVNSCKAENLIHTPIIYEPGTTYAYGNSAEWLALMFPTITGQDYEDYLQAHIFKPLGMNDTTFYPFSEEQKKKLMPLRFWNEEAQKWEVFESQLDLLKLPRTKAEIEYPAGGGGIYSSTSNYVLLVQHLLRHKLHLDDPSSVPAPSKAILSDTSVQSLFSPTMPAAALPSFTTMYNFYLGLPSEEEGKAGSVLEEGDANWSTGVAIYNPKDGRRKKGWGRRAGSVGWGGAAGTDYWMDPVSQIACVFTTQMLPGRHEMVNEAKTLIEKAVYSCLEDDS